MNQQEFHQRYEEESEQTYNALSKLDEDELLDIITSPGVGNYKIWVCNDNYQIWQVFRAKGTAKSIKPIFHIVSNLQNPYLVRYHACAALFKIAGINDEIFKGKVQYGRDENRERVDQVAAIAKLAEMIESLEA
jgi:L-rhamnose mutarotase